MKFSTKDLRGSLLAVVTWCTSFLLPIVVSAQYSNEWINFTQTYYKIPVAKTGIYRITYNDLVSAGVPVGGVDPRLINLFHRGVEQAIYIQGEDDAIFDAADFIEFYGQRNDGTLDADLYNPASWQPHTYYNLFTDTTAYFLTWNPLPVPGKRMAAGLASASGLPKETFQLGECLQVYTDEYSGGLTQGGEIQSTAFDAGEGWTGQAICTGNSGCLGQLDFTIAGILNGVPSGGTPELNLLLVGRAELPHQVEIYAGQNGGSLRMLTTVNFIGFETKQITLPLAWSDIGGDGKIDIRAKISPVGDRDVVSVSFIRINFPQDYNLAGATEKDLTLPANPSDKSYVELLNPAPGSRLWDITDAQNVKIINTVSIVGGVSAVVPGTSAGRKLFLSNSFLSVPHLQKVSFHSITPSLYNYIIITHRSLMKPALGYGDAVQAYAAYRASAAGGGYDTLTVPVDQLYNQFNYGETSPRAIYQFMKYLLSSGSPKFLFLIGKGLEVSQGFYRKTSLLPGDFRDLVPSAGMPGADVAFTAGLNGTTHEAAVPTGRLTASTPVQVAAYLNKVKESEAAPYDALWRKDLLHLSGGIHEGEPEIFRQYVDGFKTISDGYFLGGNTETISKQTFNPVEHVNVKDQVNKGLNLVTFFGHSGPGTIDIDIGFVSDPSLGYNNAGKYPGFLINGCNAGRFFDNRITFGEDWLLTPNKGAKAFIAHSFFGFTNLLKSYSDIFYSVAFGDSTFINKGLGVVQKETARRFLAVSGETLSTVTQAQQMVLLGDPAVSLFGARHPDYEVNTGSLSLASLDGQPVTAQSHAFGLDIVVRNFGRAEPVPLKVTVIRTLSDNTTIRYDSIFNPVLYSEVLRFIIKTNNLKESGISSFSVTIDPQNAIQELFETNNTTSRGFFIPINGTRNLFPTAYAVVSSPSVNLVFQATDLLAENQMFKVEIDSAHTFDSPFLTRRTVSGKVLATTMLSLLPVDSLVYYWRTKLAESPNDSLEWTTSSFVHVSGSPDGWSQNKFPQLSEDPVFGLVKDPVIGLLKFQETVSSIGIKTFGNSNPAPYSTVSVLINKDEYNIATQEQPCRDNTLNLIAFDKRSTAPYAAIPFASFFDPRACGRAPQVINNFKVSEMDTGSGDDLVQSVANVVAGDSVVIFSIGDAGYAAWSTNVKQALSQLGVGLTQLDGVQPGEPFVIFGKKGAAAGAATIFRPTATPANEQEVQVNKTITGRYTDGSLTSTIIGPASQWSHLVSSVTMATVNDEYGLDVTGIDLAGNETLLKSQTKGTVSLTDVDATKFPYLKLALNTKDLFDLTPVQLRHWMVFYSPVPEGMLTYNGSQSVVVVREGEDWIGKYSFRNFSSLAFEDSLQVQVDVFTPGSTVPNPKVFRIKAPSPGDSTMFKVLVHTLGRAGLNDISVYVNPKVLPEQYYENNFLPLYGHLQVQADQTPPLLDVTIDGRHVVDGDMVSASPIILATVLDQNPFIPKTDTTGIDMYLRYPCDQPECPYFRINFNQADVQWSAASASENFRMVFAPKNLKPGLYTLQVDAIDGSGNPSGPTPYKVSFEVTEKKGIALQSVFPNPSSDRFQFRLLVSGTDAPQDFQLRIYGSAGSVVREFGNEVLNSIHIGTNDFSIEATDANGNPLPAGIYFFRMTATLGGQTYDVSGKLLVIR